MTTEQKNEDVTISRDFCPGDRYVYDFKLCSTERGWAQIDTSQDASYYGTWINPVKREIFCYCEGDLILTRCATDSALLAEVTEMQTWNVSNGHRFIGIDPGFNPDLKTALIASGLGRFIH